jgi:hypothetical protein
MLLLEHSHVLRPSASTGGFRRLSAEKRPQASDDVMELINIWKPDK